MKTQLNIIIISIIFFYCDQPIVEKANNTANLGIVIKTITERVHPTKNAEIIFCLDATGSMSGLIGTAKEKIWDIVTELVQSGDIDSLKMGMVFYRDRGDGFVTKQITLTTDLDEVYTDLLKMQALGGGDSPESLNQALHESVSQMKWSKDQKTYRTIFVVGDCPPHMDYPDDIKYTESCKMAARKGITINTVKLGKGCQEAIPHFKNMAECSNGEFLILDQNAQDYTTPTPYDAQINTLSREIDDSRIYYGTKKERESSYNKKSKSMAVYDSGSATANSARAEYKQSKAGKNVAYGSQEIINDYENNDLDIKSIEEDQLPMLLKGKSSTEKEAIIKTLVSKRAADNKKLNRLLQQKRAYIKTKQDEQSDSVSFSKEVLQVMKKQAARSGI